MKINSFTTNRNRSDKKHNHSRSAPRHLALLNLALVLALVFSFLQGIVPGTKPPDPASAHNLQTRMVYMFFDPQTQACLDARIEGTPLPVGCAPLPGGWMPGDPILLAGDEIGVIIKVVPRDGTNTGVGGHIDFYVPNGTEVVDVGYVVPDGAGGYTEVAMKGQSPIAIGAGPIGAKTTAELIGLGTAYTNINGVTEAPVVTSTGLHRGTIAGVYGDTGIFFSTDPDTAYGSWQRYTSDSTANGCGSLAFNPTALGETLVNNSGDTVIPCNKWDAEQLMAWGVKGGTFGVSAPIVDYSDGRGNAPWGFASGVGGPQSGYAWNFDWDEWNASGRTAAAMRDAMGPDEIGPWQRIEYTGDRISYDQAGLISTVIGYASIDAGDAGVPVDDLTATTSQTDTSSPKVVRWAVGQLTAYRPEYAWVKVRVNDAAAGITDPSGCPILHGDTFGGDAGGTDNGKDHLWRYYEPTEVSMNVCLAVGKPATEEFVKSNDVFQYPVKVYNLQDFTLTNVRVEDTLGSGLSFISAFPAQNSGPNPLVWNIGTLLPGQKFESLVTVKATTTGFLDNCVVVYSDQLPPQSSCDTTISGLYPYLVPSKTVRTSSVAPGNSVIYDILVQNIGEGPTGNPITVREYLPPGFTYDPSYPPVVYINGALVTATVNATNPNEPVFTIPAALLGGRDLTITFQAIVSPNVQPGVYCNSYSVTQNSIPITTGSEACVNVAGGLIGDKIWRDWDGDGAQDVGEEGISGVTVELYNSTGTTLLATTTTDANGNYYFPGREPGTYVVKVNGGTALPGTLQTGDPGQPGVPCTVCDNQHTVTLAENQQLLTVDFGYKPTGTATIGDKVFEDIGNDGVFTDGTDTGIPNVTVWLYEDTNGDGVITANVDALVATTTSNSSGDYSFAGLAEGYDYLVKVDKNDVDLQAYFNSQYDPDPVTFQLSTLETRWSADLTGSDLDNDFGFWRTMPASIGDQLFIDTNGNGIFDTGEAPVAGVSVKLYRDGVLVTTTVSGPDGTYLFDNLGPGSYTVAVDTNDPDIPGGYFATINQYSKVLAAGEDYLTADFPFVPLISKSVDKTVANAGETLTFSVSVNYPGDEQLEGVTIIDPLPDGVTYVNNSANAGGTYGPYVSDPGSPGDGSVSTTGLGIYSINSNTPEYRLWDGGAFDPDTTDGTSTDLNIGDAPRVLVGAASPTRDEKIILAMVNGNPDIHGMMWNGTAWAFLPQPPALDVSGSLANTTDAARTLWAGAVAYERLSGDAMVVWDNGTTGTTGLTYNIWNGTSWGSNTTITTPLAGEPYQMRLAAKPGSDEMILVVSNSAGYDYALVWNGSAWGNSVTLDGASGGALTSVFVAYEQQSRDGMVVYGKSGTDNLFYRTWNGTSWSAEAALDPGSAASSQPAFVSLAADPTSDRIAVGVVSTGSTWLAVWSGSAWGSIQQATTTPAITTALNVSVGFEAFSGDLLAVYAKNGANTAFYRTWTSGGGWSTEATGADFGKEPNVLVLSPSPNSDRMMLATNDGDSDANYTVWDGSAWEATFLAQDNTGIATAQPLLFLWDRHLDPATISTVTASPVTAALGGSTTVTISLRATRTVSSVTPSLTVINGSASCTTSDTIPADVLGGVTKNFTFTCVLSSLGEIRFAANASAASGFTFSEAISNTVLVSSNGASNVVTWDLGSTTEGTGGLTAQNVYIYAFRGADQLTYWAYSLSNNNWTTYDPTDTPTGVTIKEGGALTNDGVRYIYALRGDNTRVFLRYDAQTNTWDDAGIADLPGTTTKTVLKGGSLVYLNGYVYAFVGNDTLDFWRYQVSTNSWTKMANALGTVNNGAGLTTDGTNIYATQGDGKKGFWRYNVATNTWTALAPTLDNFGDGGGLVYANGDIYALRGGGQKNFYRYSIATNTWTRLTSTAGNIDDGGAIVFDGANIYAFQGKTATFYRYNWPTTANPLGTWSTMAAAPANVGWGGALTFLASGNVTRSSLAAVPTLITDGAGDQQVTVRLTLTSQGAISNIVAGTINDTGVNGANATCGSPSLVSADDDLDGTSTDSVIFQWLCVVTAGSTPGSVTFSANASSTAPATTFGTATSNSVLLTPPLTWQAVVDNPAPAVVYNTAILTETGDTLVNEPSNTTETATTASIGDYVWSDLDGDGVQDANEYGLAGVKVYVDANNNGVWDPGERYDITDASGNYRIFGLQAGTYTVRTDPTTFPEGYVPTTPGSLSVTLTAGVQYNTADFGLQPPPPQQGSIGDYLWLDADNDGIQDAGETPLAGITVNLYRDLDNDGVIDAADPLVETVVTDANGLYTFDGLPFAHYIVAVDQTSPVVSPYDPMGSYTLGDAMNPTYDKDGGLNNLTAVTVSSTTPITDVDFGYNWSGSIGDHVWWDDNLDGDVDGGEDPIAGAVVLLYFDFNGDGVLDASEGDYQVGIAFSDASGNYTFNNLPPGPYLVDVYEDSITTDGVRDVVPTTENVQYVSLDAGESIVTIDFGYYQGARVDGNVFHDDDRNAYFEGGEEGLAGIEVTLTGTDMYGNPIERTTTTDADGHFFFLVPEGNYTLTYDTSATAADGYPDATTDTSYSFHAYPGEDWHPIFDFGVDYAGAVGDFVWNDADHDGVQDAGELGIPGVTVNLYASDGTTWLATTTTAADGTYLFDGLANGTYVVKVNPATLPVGFAQTYDNNGALDHTGVATVTGGHDNLTADFGYYNATSYTVSGNVFNDMGIIGTKESAAIDPGLAGVTVNLYDSTGTTILATTTTDSSGNYTFPGVPNGSYVLKVDTSTLPTTAFSETYEADSSINNAIPITINNANSSGNDFGFHQYVGSISGNVCVGDGDGLCEAGETELKNVTIILTYAGADGIIGTADDQVSSTTTSGTGAYTFSNLAPGLYTVQEINPSGYLSLADRDGSNPDSISVILDFGPDGIGGTADDRLVKVDQDFEDTQAEIGGLIYPDPLEVVVNAGGSAYFVQDWTNNGTATDRGNITVYDIPSGWSVSVWRDTQLTAEPPIGAYTGNISTYCPSGHCVLIATEDTGDGVLDNLDDVVAANDTGADGVPDSGDLAPSGGQVKIILSVTVPATAMPGTYVLRERGSSNNEWLFLKETDPELPYNDDSVYYDEALKIIRIPGAALGDRVWLDENSNGLQDAGETGIANAKVTAVWYGPNNNPGGGDDVTYTTWTDANGEYSFSDLPGGVYSVTVDDTTLASGLAANPTYDYNGIGTPHTATLTLTAGTEFDLADFGYNWSATTDVNNNTGDGAIGDRIWSDADGDGKQDAGEPGLGGVTVTLYTDPDLNGVYDTVYATTTTAPDGSYIFDGLPAGAYVVGVTAPPNYTLTGDPDEPGAPCTACDSQTTAPVILTAGDVYVNADFGYKPDSGYGATIGDRVWLDANSDGVLDAGEPGIPGVSVALIQDLNANGVWDAGEPIIATTVTSDTGAYLFSGVPVTDGTGTDDYLVWVNDTSHVLTGLAPTFDADGIVTPNISEVSDLTSAGDSTQDFGYAPEVQTYTPPATPSNNGTIGDKVFLDRDGGHDYDAGEGLEGVTVRLYASNGTTLLATTYTDENGSYYFSGLHIDSTYVVVVDTTTLPNVGVGLTNSVDPDPGGDSRSQVYLSSASPIRLDQDFGYTPTTANTISGTLWSDADADGLLEGTETDRLAGVTVVLYDSDGSIVATTITNASGDYSFNGLPNGTYFVDVTDEYNILDGYWKSAGTQGLDNNSQPDAYQVTVTGGVTNSTADFGYYRTPASLGNWVWYDQDGDGIQELGEVGLQGSLGFLVTLTIEYPDETTITLVTITDANGYYSFSNLLLDEQLDGAGSGEPTFTISVAAPSSYYQTLIGEGDDDELDSHDVIGTLAVVTEGASNNTYDFGFDSSPTAVYVSEFMAAFEPPLSARITWSTPTEVDLMGFNILRSTQADGSGIVQVNTELILAQFPGAMTGAEYEYIDTTIQLGVIYYYWLEVLDTGGNVALVVPALRPVGLYNFFMPIIQR